VWVFVLSVRISFGLFFSPLTLFSGAFLFRSSFAGLFSFGAVGESDSLPLFLRLACSSSLSAISPAGVFRSAAFPPAAAGLFFFFFSSPVFCFSVFVLALLVSLLGFLSCSSS
jgi:hypothetical protein